MTINALVRSAECGVRSAPCANPKSKIRNPKYSLGFTLQEAMVTVIIIGILAAVAIPNYRKAIERGYHREAQDLLMAIYNGERSYSSTHGNVYYEVNEGAANSMEEWRKIYVDNPNLGSIPVDFDVALTGGGSGFVATATKRTGPCAGMVLTMDQDRSLGGAWRSCPDI